MWLSVECLTMSGDRCDRLANRIKGLFGEKSKSKIKHPWFGRFSRLLVASAVLILHWREKLVNWLMFRNKRIRNCLIVRVDKPRFHWLLISWCCGNYLILDFILLWIGDYVSLRFLRGVFGFDCLTTNFELAELLDENE